MLRHNLQIFIRNFLRSKGSFFINIIGLSASLTCVLLIYLWVNDELNIDKFNKNDAQLYQVMEKQHNTDGSIETTEETPSPLLDALNLEISGIEYIAQTNEPLWYGWSTLSFMDKNIKAKAKFASKDFFNIFSYKILQGDKNKLLSDKNSIVISETLAMKLFGNNNVIGKSVKWQNKDFQTSDFFISGIFSGTTSESSDQFDFLLPIKIYNDSMGQERWDNFTVATYLILKEGTDVDQFNNKISNFIKGKDNRSNVSLFIKKYSEKYLYGKYENGKLTGGRIEYVKLLSLIAFFILIIACINFMNLSTAKASKRIKEIGIKKTIGVSRKSLIIQYLGESLLITVLSFIVAFMLVLILMPQFNQITGKHIELIFNKNLILATLCIILITGIISGSYPALYLSSFNPAIILKGKFKNSISELWIRKGLVIFQFTISVILIVSVIIIYKQIEFVLTKNLGYNKDNIIYFEKSGKFNDSQNVESFLSEIRNIPEILNASSTEHSMVKSESYTGGIDWPGKQPNEIIRFENITVDYNMIETLDIKIKQGRTFSKSYGADDSKIIFNEAAINLMDLKDPIGKAVNLWGRKMEIIGVTKNFNFESLHVGVKPAFFKIGTLSTMYIMIKFKAGLEKEAISKVQNLYETFNPGFPFEYKFFDENYQAQYASEERVSILSRYFAGLAILISILGIIGLVAFTAERRFKEIGIRKALGATDLNLIYHLSSDFTKIIFVSILFALPVSYLIMKLWLGNFAYKIELKAWYFISAGLAALLITWTTVGFQAVRAIKINLSECLRTND